MKYEIKQGDSLDAMRAMPDASVDAVVTDPPYGLAFMGREWDHGVPGVPFWAEALRVAKPGAHLLAFGGTRTYHRLTCAIEDAGWEIRDCIMWVYGSGFPKSADVSKMLDKHEQKQWLDVGKAINNTDQSAILVAWKEYSKTVNGAGLSFAKSETETGTNTPKSGSVPASVVLQANPESSDAVAVVAELSLSAARRTSEANCNSAQSLAESNTTESRSLATSAANLPASPAVTLYMPDSSALQSVWGWQGESTADKLKAAEALKTWLGSKPSLRPEVTVALCAALTDDLKHITSSQSKTFQGFDTTRRTACASAISATITESTAASLISFTVDTLRRKAIDKAAGAEREAVGSNPLSAKQTPKRATNSFGDFGGVGDITAPATPEAARWQGWGTALKPAVEYIIVAQKPLNLRGICGTLALKLGGAICLLQSSANTAESSSTSSPVEFGAEFGSALWDAALRCSTPGGLSALMDTSRSELAIPSSLSTALSWLDILGAILQAESTFTTETASSLITDLKILNSLSSQTIADAITEAATGRRGTESSASLAVSIFTVVGAKLASILAPSAPGLATSPDADPGLRPDWRPVIVARKPLDGTVAANVLRHGTGAINVDGCRVPTSDNLGGGGEKAETAGKFTNEGWRRPWMDDPVKSVEFAAKVRANVARAESLGRFPANLILTYPEDEYMLRDDVTPDQLHKLAEWMNENAKR